MSVSSHLEWARAGDARVVRLVPRVLGPWDGPEGPPAEAGPLLDLWAFAVARNWIWFLVPLARDCRARCRPLAVCVVPAVAGQFAVTRLDRLLPVRTAFGEAVAEWAPGGRRTRCFRGATRPSGLGRRPATCP